MNINPRNPADMKLIKKAYGNYYSQRNIYNKMYEYYKGNTDAIKNYKFVTKRSNLKANVNFLKKFIKEEVSYTVGNPITYESKSGNTDVINDIDYNTSHWDENHDSDLMKYLLIFSKVYELYYINSNNEFCSKIIKPTEGYAYVDSITGEVLFFIRSYKNEFDTNIYIDLYTKDCIYHYDKHFIEIKKPTVNIFDEVPVSVGKLSLEEYEDSIYKDLKGLQDAYETNLSDICNEISDFRSAYMTFIGCQLDEDKVDKMKELGILNITKDGKIEWLIKNINDTFIQNTLNTVEDKMYQISCHINHNEKMQSNLSGLALRSRLIALENKCSLDQKSHSNIVKNRLRFLFRFLNILKNKNYDYKDIKRLYTPNIPADDQSTAQMLSQAPGGVISKDTARGLFSFITNKVVEKEKVEKEEQELLEGSKLLDGELDE